MPCLPNYPLVGVTLPVTSTSRPVGVDRYAGQRIFEVDTLRELLYDGTGWIIMSEPWQTYTPQIDQGATTNIAKTVAEAEYSRSNGEITIGFRLGITASGTAGSAVTVSSPAGITAAITTGPVMGPAFIYDSSLGTLNVTLMAAQSTGKMDFPTSNGGGSSWGLSPSLAIANGDVMSGRGSYRMASKYS